MFGFNSVKDNNRVDEYLKLLPSFVIPVEAIFRDVDNNISDCKKRVSLKMSFLKLMAVSIGLRKESIDCLLN